MSKAKSINLIHLKEKETEKFDFKSFEKEALNKLMEGHRFGGKDRVLTPSIKRLIE